MNQRACAIFAGDIPTVLLRIPGTPASAAYADDAYDLPLLSQVGHPVAVCPDRRLRRAARWRQWEIIEA